MKSNLIANQQVHKDYGGVIPEIASREHQKNIILVVEEALKSAKVKKNDLNAISFTVGPGLLGSLLVGCSFAKSLSFALNIPLIGVDHMKAHVLSNFIYEPIPNFPFICLTVSGGHTQLVLVKDFLNMDIIGETLDDAVGEAFDKSAKILGIEYPGGPIIDKISKNGDPLKYKFSKPRISDLNFSFSGIKTSILYFVKSEIETIKPRHDFVLPIILKLRYLYFQYPHWYLYLIQYDFLKFVLQVHLILFLDQFQ